MFNRFRKNPISDEISQDDLIEYVDSRTDGGYTKIVNFATNNADALGLPPEVSLPMIENTLLGKVKTQLDDLEKKITRLAVEYAIQEAQANYGVDISEEMYAQFPTARSNPRMNRQSARYRRNRY